VHDAASRSRTFTTGAGVGALPASTTQHGAGSGTCLLVSHIGSSAEPGEYSSCVLAVSAVTDDRSGASAANRCCARSGQRMELAAKITE
jgi:hypothetical protein